MPDCTPTSLLSSLPTSSLSTCSPPSSSSSSSSSSSVQDRGELDLLVLDCLFDEEEHSTHFNLPAAIEAIRELRPRVRMSHAAVLLTSHVVFYARSIVRVFHHLGCCCSAPHGMTAP
jgi:hypothetical protein